MTSTAAFRVSILENERVVRDAISSNLRTEGFQVTLSTGNPDEFLGAACRSPPQLALVDLLLGGDGEDAVPVGLAVLRQLRERVPETLTVVLTASPHESHREQAMQAGASIYLDKHALSLSELVATLQSLGMGQPVGASLRPVVEGAGLAAGGAAETEVADSPLASLTARESEVLRYVANGADNHKIAAHLGISERTVRAHLSALYRKLSADTRTELALSARRLGVIPAPM